MQIRNNGDEMKAALGHKWEHLFRPFRADGYPAELASIPLGWLPLIDKFCTELDALLPTDTPPGIDRLQVKNSHLEIWWMFTPRAEFVVPVELSEQIEDLITRYEDESSTVCGICGGSTTESLDYDPPVCEICLARKATPSS